MLVDDYDLINSIDIDPFNGFELDHVPGTYIFQNAKKSIPVSRDSDISGFTRSRCSGDVAYAAVQGQIIDPIEHGHFEMDLGNA